MEQVTRIHDSGAVSGTFAPVDVSYFEVMVAFTHNSGAGTAVLNACGASDAWYLYVGPGSGLPGFVSMSIPVPSGCTSWSLSASGGYVDFRSVDANYVSPPPPVATNTFTPVPTETFTPSPAETQTPASTATETPTATETLLAGMTPSDTPMPSDMPSPTLISTPSATLLPGVTPSDTPVPSNTPLPPVWTNTPKPSSSSNGQGGHLPLVPLSTATSPSSATLASTVTPPPSPSQVAPPPQLVETARVMIFSTSTPTPTPKPVGGAGKSGQGFPWWLLLAGGAAAYAVGKRKKIAQGTSRYWAKIRTKKPTNAAHPKTRSVAKGKCQTGKMIAGALLIVFTDIFLGLPLAYVIISSGGVTPLAIAAEILETVVVLPVNILGIYLIASSGCVDTKRKGK